MSEYYNMNRGLNYIKKHYNNSDQNELGEYITELIDMIEVKDEIIEKYREALQLIDMIGDGEVCSFIRNFKEAKKAIDNMRTEAEKALKLTGE